MSGEENSQWTGQQGPPFYPPPPGQWQGPGSLPPHPPPPPSGQSLPGNSNMAGSQYSYPVPPPPIPQGVNSAPSNSQGPLQPPSWPPNQSQPYPGMYGAPGSNSPNRPPPNPSFHQPPPPWGQTYQGPGQYPGPPPPGMPPPGFRHPPPSHRPPSGPPPGWNDNYPPTPPRGVHNTHGNSAATYMSSTGNQGNTRPAQSYQANLQRSSSGELTRELASDAKVAEKVEESEDQQWVNGWLKEKGKEITNRKRKTEPGITIPEAKNLFMDAIQSTDKLKHIITKIEQLKGQDSASEIDALMKESSDLRVHLSSIRDKLQDPDIINGLRIKIVVTQKKRARLRRKREEERAVKEEEEERRQQESIQTEKWLQATYDKQAEEKREKEMKAAADLTLAEVRRKLVEAKKNLDLLQSLTKLRKVRKETAKQRGFVVPKESDRMFEERLGNLRNQLNMQVEVYEGEKKTLEVMMETENLEDINRERGQERKRQADRLARWEKQLKKYLFGPEDQTQPGDPLFHFKQYYYGAEGSLQTFLQIRSSWDMFLVPPNAPGGSCVPSRWVSPVVPSDGVWQSALKAPQDKAV